MLQTLHEILYEGRKIDCSCDERDDVARSFCSVIRKQEKMIERNVKHFTHYTIIVWIESFVIHFWHFLGRRFADTWKKVLSNWNFHHILQWKHAYIYQNFLLSIWICRWRKIRRESTKNRIIRRISFNITLVLYPHKFQARPQKLNCRLMFFLASWTR